MLLLINTVNSKTFTIQNTLLDSFTYSENISLIIPSISFSKTFDNNSTLKNNLELEKSSVMPNKENSTVIILGHSGYNFNAYFNDLFDLKKGDFIYLKYLGKTYTYKVFEIEYINKNQFYKVQYNKNYLYKRKEAYAEKEKPRHQNACTLRKRLYSAFCDGTRFCSDGGRCRVLHSSADIDTHQQDRKRLRHGGDRKVRDAPHPACRAVAYLRRACRTILRHSRLRLCKEHQARSLLPRAGFLIRKYRQVLDPEPCHASDDRRRKRSDGLYDDNKDGYPLPLYARFRLLYVNKARRLARMDLCRYNTRSRYRSLHYHRQGLSYL